MARESLIRCRVEEETKSSLQALAAQKGLPESALVRQLVETVVGVASPAAATAAPYRESRAKRLYVRLRADDRVLLADRAGRRGLPSATYVSVLVRSHLRRLAPLPKEELAALKRSVAELGAIGRTLNQIARVANQSGKAVGPEREDLRAMLKVAEALRDHVKRLIRANQASWEQGNDEDAH
jgi:predicted DNA binding CopG/RHH family protein